MYISHIAVTVLVALIDLLAGALLITFLSQKLSLDRAEKYVLGFIIYVAVAHNRHYFNQLMEFR